MTKGRIYAYLLQQSTIERVRYRVNIKCKWKLMFPSIIRMNNTAVYLLRCEIEQ